MTGILKSLRVGINLEFPQGMDNGYFMDLISSQIFGPSSKQHSGKFK